MSDDKIIEVDFKQDTFDSDLEDAFNGVADVFFDHFEEDQARSFSTASRRACYCLRSDRAACPSGDHEEDPPPS